MNLILALCSSLIILHTANGSIANQPHNHATIASYVKPDEINQGYLDESYRIYKHVIELDKRNEKMSDEFRTEFIDFSIQMRTENPSERILAILLSRLYVRKMALEINSESGEDRRIFNETISELRAVFHED